MQQPRERVLVVVPARFGSTRFPGKALADLGGAPLIVRTAEQAARMRTADRVVVATDDERIGRAVAAAGLQWELTGEHPTGGDRVAAVAARDAARRPAGPPPGIVVNFQGDEPLLDPADADRLVETLRRDPEADLATLAHSFDEPADWIDPNVVKVLVDLHGRALYFSRAAVPGAMPAAAPAAAAGKAAAPAAGAPGPALRHVGIYAYRRAALERLLALPRTPLEMAEGLEQLRALENGLRIAVVVIDGRPVGVDTPADLERVRRLWAARAAAGNPDARPAGKGT